MKIFWPQRILGEIGRRRKGSRLPSLFCFRGLRFPREGNVEHLPKPASCRRGIQRLPVRGGLRMRVHCSGFSPTAQSCERPERRPRRRFYSDSEGQAAGSRAAAASISFEAAAVDPNLQSFGNGISPPGTIRTSGRRAAKSNRQRVFRLFESSLAEIYRSQKIVSFGRARQLRKILMQPLLGFLQLALLNQSRNGGEVGALGARNSGQLERSQNNARACEDRPPRVDAGSPSGKMLALASAQRYLPWEIL